MLVLDDATDICWSRILKKKSDLCGKMLESILDLLTKLRVIVKIIRCDNTPENKKPDEECKRRCDNAPENKKPDEECRRRGPGIRFEYTAVGTPQQNGKVEGQFVKLASKARATLDSAGLDSNMRAGV